MTTSTKARTLTVDEATDLCSEWQRRLRLSDWLVSVGIVRLRDMAGNHAAQINWVLPKKCAVLELLHPVDYPPDGEMMLPQDHEADIVHELLHLHFAPFSAPSGTAEDVAQEQAIDLIASALVLAKREVRE